ncbi:KTHY kinase, partial [Leiothrix lutea]|nr:KTHY kinase [Leiothrix lutea]
FPADRTTEIGQLISSYLGREKNLEDHTIHLLFSANRWEHVPMMKEKLHQGITVVVDRYAFSGVAFTSAKGVSETCPCPSLCLGKQLQVEAVGFSRLLVSSNTFLYSLVFCPVFLLSWKQTVNASKSIEDLHREIKSIAEKTMEEVQNKPLGELWK